MASTRALAHAPWSASKVDLALRCPRAFYYRYIDRVPEIEVMPEARIGKAIHAALEHALKGTPVPEAMAEAQALLDGELSPEKLDRVAGKITAFLARIDDFRARHRVFREAVEVQIAVRDNGSSTAFFAGDALYRGVLDVAFAYDAGCAAIVDHKTGVRLKSLRIADQLQGYAALATASFRNLRRIWLGIHWVNDAAVEWAPPLSATTVQSEIWPRVIEGIEAAALAVEDGPRPAPAEHCLRCSYRSICPAGKDVRLQPVDDDAGDDD